MYGDNNQEVESYISQLEQAYQKSEAEKNHLANAQMSVFGTPSEDNLIRWQLDLKEDLDRIYHLLQGHVIKENPDGTVSYADPPDMNLKPFNEFGVQLIMNILNFYLNRNTLLSNYDIETINWKVHDFGIEISDLIHNRYEEMGMDNTEKIKMYPMMVKQLVDTVHSAYLRALKGGERESLRTARTVTQTEPMGGQQYGYPYGKQPPKRFSLVKPHTWV